MALEVLLNQRRLEQAREDLAGAESALQKIVDREAEIAAVISDATPGDAMRAVEERVAAHNAEKAEAEAAVTRAREAVTALEADLRAAEEKANAVPPVRVEARQKGGPMQYANAEGAAVRRFFGGLTGAERAEIFQRADVHDWLESTRAVMRREQNRAIGNVGLTIPDVMLGLIRANLEGYSKLYKHCRVRVVRGNAKQLISTVPTEAIWTDCCANLNDLTMSFYQDEFDCHRVGGYYAVCNANLEDSDIDLAAEILQSLSESLGLALDKAILYGRNAASTMKMPMGIVSRLVQTAQPDGYPATARPWADLHTSNVFTIANTVTGTALFKSIITDAGAAKDRYASGVKTWAMNQTTHAFLMAEAISINAAGALVSGMGDTMPIVGGPIEILEFIPDYVIIGGYFDLYSLIERAGQKFASSEHVRFLSDETVFKGTARYDGGPSIAEAFVAIGVNGVTPASTMSFAGDAANDVTSIAINTATASVAVGGQVQLRATTAPGTGTVTWASGTEAKATVSTSGVVTGVASGSSVITASCNGLTAQCTVTVTS